MTARPSEIEPLPPTPKNPVIDTQSQTPLWMLKAALTHYQEDFNLEDSGGIDNSVRNISLQFGKNER